MGTLHDDHTTGLVYVHFVVNLFLFIRKWFGHLLVPQRHIRQTKLNSVLQKVTSQKYTRLKDSRAVETRYGYRMI